jgi:hypothetical protein
MELTEPDARQSIFSFESLKHVLASPLLPSFPSHPHPRPHMPTHYSSVQDRRTPGTRFLAAPKRVRASCSDAMIARLFLLASFAEKLLSNQT